MSAKHKLNSAYFLIALMLAGLIGGVSSSFTIFLLTLVVLVAAAHHSGEIR